MRAIGVFDSGIGGFSILREIHKLLPGMPIHYFADQAHVPYGPRSLEEIRTFAEGVTRFLLAIEAQLIVVACNTASAAALHHLRKVHTMVPFVGMEPAVKPAAQSSRSHKVAVLATPTTFDGELFSSVVERFAQDVEVIKITLPGLVKLIETGEVDGRQTDNILKMHLESVIADGVDTLVLACTHYPFIIPSIHRLFGSKIKVIDPAPAIAKQTSRVLRRMANKIESGTPAKINYYSTGDPEALANLALQLIGIPGNPCAVHWVGMNEVQDKP
ncbi:MAG: glutamate racemase [Chloroflexi bacterium]|nr:glutamate racemase [Chloroflexota bacterium]